MKKIVTTITISPVKHEGYFTIVVTVNSIGGFFDVPSMYVYRLKGRRKDFNSFTKVFNRSVDDFKKSILNREGSWYGEVTLSVHPFSSEEQVFQSLNDILRTDQYLSYREDINAIMRVVKLSQKHQAGFLYTSKKNDYHSGDEFAEIEKSWQHVSTLDGMYLYKQSSEYDAEQWNPRGWWEEDDWLTYCVRNFLRSYTADEKEHYDHLIEIEKSRIWEINGKGEGDQSFGIFKTRLDVLDDSGWCYLVGYVAREWNNSPAYLVVTVNGIPHLLGTDGSLKELTHPLGDCMSCYDLDKEEIEGMFNVKFVEVKQ